MLYNLFLLRGKVPEAKGEDLEFNKFILLEDNLVINSLQKCKARKASKKYLKKKLKIKPIKPLTFNRANRQKGKIAIITKVNEEVVIKKPQLKWKIKCLCYFKILAKLIEALNSKKELKGSIFFIL